MGLQWLSRENSKSRSLGKILSPEMTIFLQMVKEDPLQFQDLISKIREQDFGEDFDSHVLGDFSAPLNEIRTSKACETLVKPSVCQTQKCCRHMLSL